MGSVASSATATARHRRCALAVTDLEAGVVGATRAELRGVLERERQLAGLRQRNPDALRPVYDEHGNRIGYERLRMPGR